MRRTTLALSACLLFASSLSAQTPVVIEHGTYGVHLVLRTIGTEEYTLTDFGTHQQLAVTTTTSDRGNRRTVISTLDVLPNLTPIRFEQRTVTPTSDTTSLTEISGNKVTVTEANSTRTFNKPLIAFPGVATMPAAVQMFMFRYWLRHQRPARLPLLRADPQALPIEIHAVGHEAFTVHGETVRLTRYTVSNLIFGHEVLWMNESNRVAALMTFAGGLPQEEVLDEYKPAFDQLIQSGVRQQLLDLADITRAVRPLAATNFVIVGARLIAGTDEAPIEKSTVIVRKNLIAAAGPASSIRIPSGIRIIHAEGKTLIPGLWEMHAHVSGVEDGPALLAQGITTVRDCGGEFRFLTELRHAIDTQHAVGPRLLLAGLIDGGGPNAFGAFTADTPEEATIAVDLYADAHFDQIAPYTQIQPGVLKAIAAEATKRGLTLADCPADAIGTLPDMAAELELATKSGMTPIAAIQSATIVPARALHHDTDSGTIEPGKRADLVLIDGNPLEDITTLRHVDTVVANGRAYNAKSLTHSVGFNR